MGSSTEMPSTNPSTAAAGSTAPGDQSDDVRPVQVPFKEMESDWADLPAATPAKERTGRMREGLENSYACPEPWPFSEDRGLAPYDRYVNRALGLPPKTAELLVVRISPPFSPERTLSLIRLPDGSYRLRSRRLLRQAWAEMMAQMGREQGAVIRFDEHHQARALSGLQIPKSDRERRLDRRTAELMLRLWTALVGRAQVVREVGVFHATLDGTVYRIWQGNRRASTYAPKPASVLHLAVLAAERLECLVAEDSGDEDLVLEEARFEMTNALQRTCRRESCLEAVSGWSD